MKKRIEHDSMGDIEVDDSAFWGAQTQRSLENFKINNEKMPIELIYALTTIKKAMALSNSENDKLSVEISIAISNAADVILEGKLDAQFPLSVWQTGSGTQTNMNVNEVLAHIASQSTTTIIHPNDHVNMSQSSNDVFPSAIHIAIVQSVKTKLLPSLDSLIQSFKQLEETFGTTIKIGRTHLQDATPIRFSQEVSGWRVMIEETRSMINESLSHLLLLPLGGTAVGTGLNTTPDITSDAIDTINQITDTTFEANPNKFHGLTSKDAVVFFHGALKALAANLMKIANDIRWLASGPRSGLGELTIPSNEPGSSIMPGKVNPTQCEAITMIAAQVMGNDATIGFAASQGNFELNVFMPVIAYNAIQSINLLADGCQSFTTNCIDGITINEERMNELLSNSLMLVTALNSHIGYDKASEIAKLAYNDSLTLKEAALKLNYVTKQEFDEWVRPENMV